MWSASTLCTVMHIDQGFLHTHNQVAMHSELRCHCSTASRLLSDSFINCLSSSWRSVHEVKGLRAGLQGLVCHMWIVKHWVLRSAVPVCRTAPPVAVTGLTRICHQYGVPLIVDEAHGSHLAFHSAFPQVIVFTQHGPVKTGCSAGHQ